MFLKGWVSMHKLVFLLLPIVISGCAQEPTIVEATPPTATVAPSPTPISPPASFLKHEDSLRKSELNLSSRPLFAYS